MNRWIIMPVFFVSIFLLIKTPALAINYSETNGVNTNPCAAGQFTDLRDSTCKPLVHTEYGFNTTQFNTEVGTAIYTLQTCTETAFKSLLTSIGTAGGTVNLPACTLPINGPLELPSNILLQGAGKDKTIIKADTNSVDQLIKLKDKRNIVIRDLSIDANAKNLQTLLIWYANNILLERINVYNSARTAVELRYINRITVRNISAHDSGTYHGIVIKDCLNETPIPTLARCEAQYASSSHTYGTLWTTSFLIYSNLVYYNKDHGMDIHGVDGEVAGNISHMNMYGSKFFDSIGLDVHHNSFDGNSSWGTHINTSVDVPAHIPNNIAFYQNSFTGSQSDYPVRIADPATNIILAYNTYSGNVNNKLRITAASSHVLVCADGQDAQMAVDGNPPTTLSSAECLKYKTTNPTTPTITPSPALSPTASPTPVYSACNLKASGDADCNGAVDLADFQIWRDEYFANCTSAIPSACGADADNNGATIDANYNGPEVTSTNSDSLVNLVDFEIWRKYYLTH